ncbi:MAG: hypothetical protein ACI4M5_05410 [Christensenellales bacterium]
MATDNISVQDNNYQDNATTSITPSVRSRAYDIIDNKKSITIPLLQKELNLSYLDAKSIIDDFLSLGFIEYRGGIVYAKAAKKVKEKRKYDLDVAKERYIDLINKSLSGSIVLHNVFTLTLAGLDNDNNSNENDFTFEFNSNKEGYYIVNVGKILTKKQLASPKFIDYIGKFSNVFIYGGRIWVQFKEISKLFSALITLHSIVQLINANVF